MAQRVLFIKLLLLPYTIHSVSPTEMSADCYENVTVECPGIDNMDFISVAWYKLGNSPKLGIIRRGKNDKNTQDYNFTRSIKAEFGENNSLMLPRVMPEDSGTYECEISAHVGGTNQYPTVDLRVPECVTQAATTSTTPELTTTPPDSIRRYQVEDLPVKWSVIGYVAVGLTKVILSLITIWVIQTVRMRSSRRRQRKW